MTTQHPNCDFAQPGTLYSKVLNDKERTNLVENLVEHMKNVKKFVNFIFNNLDSRKTS